MLSISLSSLDISLLSAAPLALDLLAGSLHFEILVVVLLEPRLEAFPLPITTRVSLFCALGVVVLLERLLEARRLPLTLGRGG